MHPWQHPFSRLGGLAALALLGLGGTAAAHPQRAAASQAVNALVGDAVCSSDSDCRTIATPDQACGAPQGWLAFSIRRTDPVALQQALQRLAAYPASSVSTCGVIPDPGATCVPVPTSSAPEARQCRLRSRASGGPLS